MQSCIKISQYSELHKADEKSFAFFAPKIKTNKNPYIVLHARLHLSVNIRVNYSEIFFIAIYLQFYASIAI